MTWRPTQFVSVNWQNYDRHFHTFLESTEYFSTLWGSPFPVNLSRKGTHRQESAIHQLLRRRRSSWIALSNGACTVQVLQSKFWRRENCWSIQIILDRATNEASSTSFVKKYTPTQGFRVFIDAISPQCMCGALVTAPRFSPNLGLAYRLKSAQDRPFLKPYSCSLRACVSFRNVFTWL